MAISVSVQYDDGSLPDIICYILCYFNSLIVFLVLMYATRMAISVTVQYDDGSLPDIIY